jgi:tetratricopeptide (TPR) repeat protein
MNRAHCLVFLFIIFSFLQVQAQPAFDRGLQFEQQFKVEDALAQYELVLKENPNHAAALTHASRMISNIGGRLPVSKKTDKAALYEKSRVYAARAVELEPNNIEAHLALVISLGLLSEVSDSPSEKVKNAKLIYTEGQAMLRLDSAYSAAYFVLGKWHFELARLNWMERMACQLFFGGLPEGISMDKAVLYLQKASVLEPNTILYLFGEARAYYYLGEESKAIRLLKHALTLPIREPDDMLRKERCQELLKEIERG